MGLYDKEMVPRFVIVRERRTQARMKHGRCVCSSRAFTLLFSPRVLAPDEGHVRQPRAQLHITYCTLLNQTSFRQFMRLKTLEKLFGVMYSTERLEIRKMPDY